MQHSAGILIRFIATIIRVRVRVRVRVSVSDIRVTQPRVRAKFRLRVLKDPVYKKLCIYLRKFIIPSAVAALAVSLGIHFVHRL